MCTNTLFTLMIIYMWYEESTLHDVNHKVPFQTTRAINNQ